VVPLSPEELNSAHVSAERVDSSMKDMAQKSPATAPVEGVAMMAPLCPKDCFSIVLGMVYYSLVMISWASDIVRDVPPSVDD